MGYAFADAYLRGAEKSVPLFNFEVIFKTFTQPTTTQFPLFRQLQLVESAFYKDYNIYITTERTDIMLQENLIMLRSLAGKTQEDIAEVIGISRQAYAKWERGETIPDIEKCGRLAEFYGVTMDSLIKDNVQLEGQKMAPAPNGKHMWGVVTVNDRGQIVIPKEARETFGLVNGSRLVVLGDDNEGIALVKAEQFEEKLSMAMSVLSKDIKE